MTFAVQRHCWTVRLWRPHERRMASPNSFSRRLCVAAVTAAFVIGIVVGILLPLYVPSSALLSHSGMANRNASVTDGPWEGAANDVEGNPASQNDPEKPRAGTPHGALSRPRVDTSSTLPPPSAKSPASGTLKDLYSQKWKVQGNDDASRNRVRTDDLQSVSKDVFSKKRPRLADLLRPVSGKPPRKLDPPANRTGQGSRAPMPAVTTSPNARMPQITRPLDRSAGLEEMPLEALVDGVYWSDRVERSLPTGFSEKDVADWTSFADNATVVKVAEGCGRMQNRLLVFDSGTMSCCRYRQNNDQIQGEIFSFYLAQLLGLRSLPPATLGLLHGHEGQWRTVRGQLTLAQWNEQKPVVMTKFVDDLVPAHIPRHFRGDGPREHRRLHPLPEDLAELGPEELREMAQWSDLVIFDYLTANLDRVVNNMYNKQWNPDMMSAPAHNLAKVAKTGLLVFLDNESGLLHGYRLLDKYESYHKAMLEGLCVFRRSTARAVLTLHYAGDVGQRLKMALMESQPQMAEWLPLLPDKSVKILRERLARVARQILQCEHMYTNASSTTDSNLIGSRYDLHDTLTRPMADTS